MFSLSHLQSAGILRVESLAYRNLGTTVQIGIDGIKEHGLGIP